MAKAKISITAAEVRVWDGEDSRYGDPFDFFCTLKSVTLRPELCELGGVVDRAPTREQLKAIHQAVFDAGFQGYLRTDGKTKKIVHLVNRHIHSGERIVDLKYKDPVEVLDMIIAELW